MRHPDILRSKAFALQSRGLSRPAIAAELRVSHDTLRRWFDPVHNEKRRAEVREDVRLHRARRREVCAR